LGKWQLWTNLPDAIPGEKNLRAEGSSLANLNYTIYGDCKNDCKDTLDDKCVKCLCTKGTGKKDYTEEECTAWLCGGSNNNWVCCREQGVSRMQLVNEVFNFPQLGPDQKVTAKAAYQIIKLWAGQIGIRPAFVLAIFRNETSMGANLGGCTADKYEDENKDTTQFTAIKKIIGQLNPGVADVATVLKNYPISCAPPGQSGGAMGPTQIMPKTWLSLVNRITDLTGHNPPNPWNTTDMIDPFVGAMYYLHDECGAKTEGDERKAAGKYRAGPKGNLNLDYVIEYMDNAVRFTGTYQQLISDGCFEDIPNPEKCQ